MSIFDIIDNVDWNKNIIFLVLYITIVVLCVFIYLVPLMDNYKSVIMEYRKTNILDNQINTTLDRLKGSETEILRDNMEVFERLQHKMTAKDLQKYARTHIKGANVEDLGVVEAENGILIHSFKITGQTRKLLNIRNLLSNVRELQNSVRIAFPITITKDERRRVLNAEISVMVYNSTRDISALKAQLEKEMSAVSESAESIESIESTESTESAKHEKVSEVGETIDIIETISPESSESIEPPKTQKPSKTRESTKANKPTKSQKSNAKDLGDSNKAIESNAKDDSSKTTESSAPQALETPKSTESHESNAKDSSDSKDNNATISKH